MRTTLALLIAIILTLSMACGGSDTVEPTESSADAGADVAEEPIEDATTDPDTSTKDDAPEVEPRVMHTRLEGAIDDPTTCNELCEAESLVCDGDYHTFIGTGGGKAVWGPIEDMIRCDEAPTTLRTSYTGVVFELSNFECYCLPPDD